MRQTELKERYYSPSQTARLLGVSRVRVTHLSQQGRLPFLETPNGRIFPKVEIDAIAAAKKKAEK